ncbi:MAG: hypothetical protein ACXVQJ_00745 [Actinomycetota bacterium]
MRHMPSEGLPRVRAGAPALAVCALLLLVGCTTPVGLKTEAASSESVSPPAPTCVDRGAFLRVKRLSATAIAEATAALRTSPLNRHAVADALQRAAASVKDAGLLTERGQAKVGHAFSRTAQALRGAAASALTEHTDVTLRRIQRATLSLTLGTAHVHYDDYC